MSTSLHCSILILIISSQSIQSDSYYSINSDIISSQSTQEEWFNNYGRHLVSIHSVSENQKVTSFCKSQCDLDAELKGCGIGLKIEAQNNSLLMQWTDATEIEPSIINESWCKGHPIIDYNNLSLEYTPYIDATEMCWKSTTNSTIRMCAIGGPEMFDATGFYWIANFYIPLIGSIIALPYSVYCVVFLTKHLCITRHSWIETHDVPTKCIKITAILIPTILTVIFIFVITFCSMLYSAYEQTGIMQQSLSMDPDYPYIYTQIGIIQGCILCLLYLHIPLGYIHVELVSVCSRYIYISNVHIFNVGDFFLPLNLVLVQLSDALHILRMYIVVCITDYNNSVDVIFNKMGQISPKPASTTHDLSNNIQWFDYLIWFSNNVLCLY